MKKLKDLSIIFIILILITSCDNFGRKKEAPKPEKNICTTSECNEWEQGQVINSSGSIDMLESPMLYIAENGNEKKLLTIKSRINKWHKGFHFYFNILPYERIEMPENIRIRISNNKNESIILEGTESNSKNHISLIEYNSFIQSKDNKKTSFVLSELIRKIEFINLENDKVLFYVIPSFSESIEIKKLFCCASTLKENVVGQE